MPHSAKSKPHPIAKTKHALIIMAAMTCLSAYLFLATLFLPRETQIAVDTALLSGLLVASFFRRGQTGLVNRTVRAALIAATIFLWFRYLNWRAHETLPLQFGSIAIGCGVLLLLAECYLFLTTSLGSIACLHPRNRAALPLPSDSALLPTVDVVITTYDEHPDILRPTVIAATQMRYPAHKIRVYVLDDGGTAQKCTDPDPKKSAAARTRANQIKAIAAHFGAIYCARETNDHAKAGNINHGLTVSQGELIVVLDCDHIPTADFIENTVGFFLADPTLFLVQTAHYFVNPDPLERNLATFGASPAEYEMFFSEMQPGFDAWGASFFCGSAAVLRRSALDEIGGFAGQTVTEDFETTIAAMAHGYTSAYFARAMISGLQPEPFSGFIRQRTRWSQGMTQVLLLKNPWLQARLSFMQRVLFTNLVLFWGRPFFRLILLLAPPAMLLLSIPLVEASVSDMLIFGGPPLIASFITSRYLYGLVRWPFFSQLYDVMQSVHLIPGLFNVLRRPRSPSFMVTQKGEVMQEDFISSLARPFYLLLCISIAALINATLRYAAEPGSQDRILMVSVWALLDLALVMCALGITFERRQRRTEPRVTVDESVRLHVTKDLILDGTAIDASTSGIRIQLHCDAKQTALLAQLAQHTPLRLQFVHRAISLTSIVQDSALVATGATLGLAYRFNSAADERTAVAIAFGSSEQLQKNIARRHQGKSLLMGLLNVFGLAVRYGLGHCAFLASAATRRHHLARQTPALEEK